MFPIEKWFIWQRKKLSNVFQTQHSLFVSRRRRGIAWAVLAAQSKLLHLSRSEFESEIESEIEIVNILLRKSTQSIV